MKDMWGKEAKVGDTFVHPGRQCSSIWMNKYVIVSIDEGTAPYRYGQGPKIKARKCKALNRLHLYKKWDGDTYRDMTEAEIAKENAKTVTITTFSDRSTIL